MHAAMPCSLFEVSLFYHWILCTSMVRAVLIFKHIPKYKLINSTLCAGMMIHFHCTYLHAYALLIDKGPGVQRFG